MSVLSFDDYNRKKTPSKREKGEKSLHEYSKYLLSVCSSRRTREREKNARMTQFLSRSFFFLLHTRVRCDNIFFGRWLVLFVCVYVRRKEILSHVNLHIHERDDGIGRYDNIFSFSLLLSLPIVNRSLSLSRSLSFLSICALTLFKWRQRTEMSSKQSALPHRK